MADVFGVGSIMGSLISGAANTGIAALNNYSAADREEHAREENYIYNELSASHADARTRKLYEDLYSPAAQLRQLKEAGLSPSLFYGDGGGISGQAGAQGGGAAGVAPSVFGIPPIDLSQMNLISAQTEKTKAETANIKSQTKKTDIESDILNLDQKLQSVDFELVTSVIYDDNGKANTSLYEIAGNCYSYEQFLEKVRNIAEKSGNERIKEMISTERGQQTMRAIYHANSKFEHDIAILSRETVDANFYKQITDELGKEDFPKLNAKDAIKQLNLNIAQNTLDEQQKKAWNNIIEKLKRQNSTTADILIVLGLILNNAMSNWRLPSKRGLTINNNKGG